MFFDLAIGMDDALPTYLNDGYSVDGLHSYLEPIETE